jgi:hypothetical protein
MLTQHLDVRTFDAERLSATLETFVEYLAFWTGYLPGMQTGTPEAGAAVPVGDSGTFIRV